MGTERGDGGVATAYLVVGASVGAGPRCVRGLVL
jgi:hypothetical protein